MSKFYHSFGNMCWPRAGEALNDLQWRLRYFRGSITDSDMLVCASILSAYFELIRNKTVVNRNYICSQLKKAEIQNEIKTI